ncbi:putative mitochondrial hypothetical protein [Leptomonas pyrrhocoris]|uniref:Transmembrane protein n=1 Tax=Leptomonas pyrrhocoris TaxID=157538 RepID=A0A0M9G3P7_LEPPY|nr:putative mitochondrial hypothetical protein [Leptomonas pyrrhocoris]KPA81519.1 putative mitochondrial hypothetical protein [Leptomonas pyrrhocoris]|eukprot:XP_015659958.1 putative mitochondrial hypothetical protein [Leptomonas pyrrhocoris]
MRVHTYHKHAVQRNSPLLHALLSLHAIFSVCYSAPIFFTFLGLRWQRQSTTSTQRTWMICVLVIWFCAELGRLYLGRLANRQTLFGELIGFLSMTIVPQIVLMGVLFGLLPQRNDLEYGVCITQLILLGLEFLTATQLLVRITRNNVIDFYVALGSPYSQ